LPGKQVVQDKEGVVDQIKKSLNDDKTTVNKSN